MGQRTAQQFSRSEIAKIVSEYANPKNAFDYRNFMKNENISKHTFFALLERGVVEGIADESTVDQMEKKAIFNVTQKHQGNGSENIRNHYTEMRRRRKEYVFPEEKIVALIKEYSNSKMTKREFCKEMVIDTKWFDNVFRQYITTDKVEDDVFNRIYKKALIYYEFNQRVIDFWYNLISERKSNQSRGK